MKMPFGQFGPKNFPPDGVDICFINSGYLKWLREQEWFFMPKRNENLVVAVEKEWKLREDTGHFWQDKVRKN